MIHALSLRNLAYVHTVDAIFRLNNDSLSVRVEVEDDHLTPLVSLQGN